MDLQIKKIKSCEDNEEMMRQIEERSGVEIEIVE